MKHLRDLDWVFVKRHRHVRSALTPQQRRQHPGVDRKDFVLENAYLTGTNKSYALESALADLRFATTHIWYSHDETLLHATLGAAIERLCRPVQLQEHATMPEVAAEIRLHSSLKLRFLDTLEHLLERGSAHFIGSDRRSSWKRAKRNLVMLRATMEKAMQACEQFLDILG
jgi:hypothetical protein